MYIKKKNGQQHTTSKEIIQNYSSSTQKWKFFQNQNLL